MDQFISDKLDMTFSTFHQNTKDKIIPHTSKAYMKIDDVFTEKEHQYLMNPTASALMATANDMSNLMLTLLNQGSFNGNQVISPSSMGEMLDDQSKYPQDAEAMGYGVFHEQRNGHRTHNHGGGICGFISKYEIFPAEGYGFFMAQNSRYGSEGFFYNVKKAILHELMPINSFKKETIMMTPSMEQKLNHMKVFISTAMLP